MRSLGERGVYSRGSRHDVTDSVDSHYERAYDLFSRDVFRFVLAWTNEWTSAEDLTQEAYLRLWRHRHAIDWDRPILPWLLVTSRRLANNRFRGLRRQIAPRRTPRGVDESVHAQWLDLRQALRALTALERTALIQTAVEGHSYNEVAVALATTPGAVRAAVSRARDKLEAEG